MKFNQLQKALEHLNELTFVLPNGESVPAHFHVTEVGLIAKHYIDCGGAMRNEKVASFQLWVANDVEHRLTPSKFLGILAQSETLFGISDLEIEVEYQVDTINKFHLAFQDGVFKMKPTYTDCLAKDHCGIPPEKLNKKLSDLTPSGSSCCTPGSGCC
jgi:hypothetical protein